MRDEFLTKAKENLRAAEVLFEHQLYNAAVNRAYYAAFHVAIAALADQDIATGRRGHATIQANFAKVQSVSSRVARRQLTKAQEFVEAVVRELAP